jgi:glycine cleavage system transcriptional repressor
MLNQQFVISVTSRDRIGIVFDVASRLSALRGDITELRQRVLQGYFTMILLATFPPDIDSEQIQQALAEIHGGSASPLRVAVLPACNDAGTDQPVAQENIYVLTATGSDRIGFVAAVAGFCAEHEINILDLATVARDEQYIMMLQVDLSRCASLATIQRQLQQFAARHAIHVVLQHNDIFEATHEINLPR